MVMFEILLASVAIGAEKRLSAKSNFAFYVDADFKDHANDSYFKLVVLRHFLQREQFHITHCIILLI